METLIKRIETDLADNTLRTLFLSIVQV